jgi:XTP/dITP diphosphohydrolase
MSSALDDLVAVMDRLRSPGGCPWDAAQTHQTLARYTLEEAYELVEAIEEGDRAGIREELGDVLLQVVFNARVAAEHPETPFTLDDVAADLTAKLVRRHPHVFADEQYVDDVGLATRWDAIKQTEKQRTSLVDGIPLAIGALSRAQKVLGRAERAGVAAEAFGPDAQVAGDAPGVRTSSPAGTAGAAGTAGRAEPVDDEATIGAELLALVQRAQRAGVDAEGALRASLRVVEARLAPDPSTRL